jgi:hypothetical protein
MSLKLGSTTITKGYLGSTEITKMYLGSTLILDSGSVNIVSNGIFVDGTDWNLASNWAISGGTLNANVAVTTTLNTPITIPTDTVTYQYDFDITAYTSGSIRVQLGGVNTPNKNGVGHKSGTLTAGATGTVGVRGVDFIGSIDNLVITVL